MRNRTEYHILRPLLLVALLWAVDTHGQIFTIADGSVTTCSGAIVDSGGEGGPGYSNGENFTVTICPDAAGLGISLNSVIFDLSEQGIAPLDAIEVFDGNDVSAPSLGVFTGANEPGILTASFFNPTGCLTIRFTSNNIGTGYFAFAISCFVPCQPPTALATMGEPSPAHICQGEEVQFNASGSSAAPGYSVNQYFWDFGDGTVDSTSGPIVSHTFTGAPSEHIVHLDVEDDNGCLNTNSADLQILVSTTPEITGLNDQVICVGETATLNAHAEAVTWSGQPIVDFGEGILLPDELGIQFCSSIVMDQFAAGQTMTSVSDIPEICFVMEHSFIGDFVLEITSPTGQNMVFHQQGGGGTYLGEPVDDDLQENAIGTCYQYCFSPFATNGTWVDNAGGTMPSGTYEPIEPFTNLIGSQMNGTWTICFTDLWGSDNGYICSWWIDFDPSLLPPITIYTPTLDLTDTDSTFWTGNNVVMNASDPTIATIIPTTTGTDVYTFTVVDNFGCTYDTTLTLTVNPSAAIDPTATLPAECGDPVQLNAGLQTPYPLGPVVYQWSPGAGLTSTSVASPLATPVTPTWYVLHAFNAGHPLCGSLDSVYVNPPTTLENDSIVVDAICHDDGTGSITVITTGNGGPWNYTWTDEDGNVVQTTNIANGDVFNGNGGTYQVRIEEGPNGNGCADSLWAFIAQPEEVEITFLSNDTMICRTGLATLIAEATGGSGNLTFHWNTGSTGSPYAVSPTSNTVYSVWATDPNGCISSTHSVGVNVRSLLSFQMIDSIISCPNVLVTFTADSAGGGDGAFQYDWGSGFQPEATLEILTDGSMQQCVTLSDGCETPDITRCLWLEVLELPELILTSDSVLGCDPFFTRFHIEDTTNAALAQWDFGDGVFLPGPTQNVGHTFDHPGTYDVTVVVQWPNTCYDTLTVQDMITAEPVPDASFTWAPQPVSVLAPEVQFIDQSGPFATSWVWDFAGMDTAHGPEPIFIFPSDVGGTYPVQLVVENYLGCQDSVLRMVEIADEFLLFIPNSFTPDADGINDQLFVLGDDIDSRDFSFMLFDRWGEKIFETTDMSIGWDGSYNGAIVPQGVYAWRIRARSAYTQTPFEQLGHVTVLR